MYQHDMRLSQPQHHHLQHRCRGLNKQLMVSACLSCSPMGLMRHGYTPNFACCKCIDKLLEAVHRSLRYIPRCACSLCIHKVLHAVHRAVRRTLDLRKTPGTALQSRKVAGWRKRRALTASASTGRAGVLQSPDLLQRKTCRCISWLSWVQHHLYTSAKVSG